MSESSANIWKLAKIGNRDDFEAALKPDMVYWYNSQGLTMLDVAAEAGNAETAAVLLEHGASVNGRSRLLSPLTRAAHRGHADVVAVLLAHNADTKRPAPFYASPLMDAAFRGHEKAVALLVPYVQGEEINETLANGNTILMASIEAKEETDIPYLLLDHDAYPNVQNKNGDTALMLAAKQGHVGTVCDLLKYGANPHLTNKDGLSAFQMATKPQIKQMLIEAGVEPTVQTVVKAADKTPARRRDKGMHLR